jgi:hypothetical protein
MSTWYARNQNIRFTRPAADIGEVVGKTTSKPNVKLPVMPHVNVAPRPVALADWQSTIDISSTPYRAAPNNKNRSSVPICDSLDLLSFAGS